ncbi:MAG: hypothetical protein ACO3JG_11740 [Luteolibacter sp.]
MNPAEINSLFRERAVLRRMLEDTPEEKLIERRSINSRIDTLDKMLKGLSPMPENQPRPPIDFDQASDQMTGLPVLQADGNI